MVSSSQRKRGLVVFQVAGQIGALPIELVGEIIPMATLAHPPCLPSIVAGFLNLEGASIPVLRLDRLFGLPEQLPGVYTPLVVLRGFDPALALLVDKVDEIIHVPEEALAPVQQGEVFNGCVEAEIAYDQRVIHLLSLERLLLEQERQRLAEFQAMAQQRLDELEEAQP